MKMGGIKGALALSVFVLCGLVLTGVDNCEGDHVTAPGTDAAASNAASDTADAAKVSGISGKEWKLAGLRKGDAIITIDRNKLRSEGFGDFFTFNIDGRRISGKAAPNRYTTAYQAGAGNALSLAPPVSTLMAPVYDPGQLLREEEYFQYLINVTAWKLNQGKLELYTTDQTGKETVLIYGN